MIGCDDELPVTDALGALPRSPNTRMFPSTLAASFLKYLQLCLKTFSEYRELGQVQGRPEMPESASHGAALSERLVGVGGQTRSPLTPWVKRL